MNEHCAECGRGPGEAHPYPCSHFRAPCPPAWITPNLLTRTWWRILGLACWWLHDRRNLKRHGWTKAPSGEWVPPDARGTLGDPATLWADPTHDILADIRDAMRRWGSGGDQA